MAYKVSKEVADKVCAARNAAARKGVYFEVARANAENTLFYVSEYERDHNDVAQFKGQVFITEEYIASIEAPAAIEPVAQSESPAAIRYAVANNKGSLDISNWVATMEEARAILEARGGSDVAYIMDTESLEESRHTSAKARAILESIPGYDATAAQSEILTAAHARMWIEGQRIEAAKAYITHLHATAFDKPLSVAFEGVPQETESDRYSVVQLQFRCDGGAIMYADIWLESGRVYGDW